MISLFLSWERFSKPPSIEDIWVKDENEHLSSSDPNLLLPSPSRESQGFIPSTLANSQLQLTLLLNFWHISGFPINPFLLSKDNNNNNNNIVVLKRTSAVRRLLPRNLRGYTTSDQREADYKRRDNVPPFYKLIYRGPLEAYIAWSVHMSTFSACAITVAALVAHLRGDVVRPMLTDWDLVSEPNDIYYFALGFLVINVMVRLVVSKIPLRIYKIDNES